MKRYSAAILTACLLFAAAATRGAGVPEFRDLFNGKNLAGWVNVNTAPDTWSIENGMLVCSGHPIGVMRTDRMYENFVLHVEWMHTEPGGNSPRAIETRLVPRAGGGFTLSGHKRWSTMAPVASVLLVAAHEGVDETGRKRFKLVRVAAAAPGVTIQRMPPTKFIPEIPHAELRLTDVAVENEALLPGDGYADYVKRFRTVEDIHIHGAVLGYFLGAARRFAFPDTVIERAVSAIVATRVLAALDSDAAETHVALAGTLARDANLLEHSDAHWEKSEPAERDCWRRDRQGFGSVAGELREARRRRAWERLASSRE